MKNWVIAIIQRFNHMLPEKIKYSPRLYNQPALGSKNKCAPNYVTSTKFSDQGTKYFQSTEGSKRTQITAQYLLCYARDARSKLLAALGEEATQVALATAKDSKVIDQLLDCVASRQNDGIAWREISAQLEVHSGAGYVNKNQARIRTSACAYLPEDAPTPEFSGEITTTA